MTAEPMGVPQNIVVGFSEAGVMVVAPPLGTLAFDPAGRPLGLHRGGAFYARGLDGRWLEKKRGKSAAAPESVAAILKKCLKEAPSLDRRGRLEVLERGVPARKGLKKALRFFRAALDFSAERRRRDEKRFRRLYGTVGILPPDQYLSLVVRVAEGCAWNRCTFCRLYKGIRWRVLAPAEIRRQAAEAGRFFGKALAGRTSLFLGDADIFQAPPRLLFWAIRFLSKKFPRLARPQEDGMGGFYAFGETTSLLRWKAEDLERLARLGLRRVTIGLETGDDRLRRQLKKPGTARQALEAAGRLKAAGIDVSPVVLLGIGGKRHVEATKKLLKAMPLNAADIVYLSPLRSGSRSGAGIPPGARSQMGALSLAFKGRDFPSRPRLALYDIRQFLY